MNIKLFPKDSPEDLLLRGFARKSVLEISGIDPGAHSTPIRKHISGIDSVVYKIEYVRQYFSDDEILHIINVHQSHADVLSFFGLNGKISIEKLFNGLGFGDEYVKARNTKTYTTLQRAVQDKYGVDHIMQLEEFQEKSKQTCLQIYGTEYATQSDAVRKKTIATNRRKYGVENPKQFSKFQEKAKQTCLENHGVEYPMQSNKIVEKSKKTSMLKYGTSHPMQSEDVKDKVVDTCVKKYGVRNVFQSDEVKKRIKSVMLENYGVENPKQYVVFKEKSKRTCFEHNGVEYPMQSETIKIKSVQSSLKKYGVPNPMQSEIVKQKMNDTKHKHHTFNVSKAEQQLYKMLVNKFGEDDVLTQYNLDPRYPFCCDFYIKSRDMFIELNAFWTHGEHWFNSFVGDNETLKIWQQRAITNYFYLNAIHTWTTSDVKKRNIAKQNNLNYGVFWDSSLSDVKLWFEADCPNRYDY